MNHLTTVLSIALTALLHASLPAQPSPEETLPVHPALLGLVDPAQPHSLIEALTPYPNHLRHRTCEKCSGTLTVEDAFGRRFVVPRGGATWVQVLACGTLRWFCNGTRELTRGIRATHALVWHAPRGRNIVIRW